MRNARFLVRKILASIVLFCPTVASAEECYLSGAVHKWLSQEHGEAVEASSHCGDGVCAVWTNRTAGTYTFLYYPGDGSACVLQSGAILTQSNT